MPAPKSSTSSDSQISSSEMLSSGSDDSEFPTIANAGAYSLNAFRSTSQPKRPYESVGDRLNRLVSKPPPKITTTSRIDMSPPPGIMTQPTRRDTPIIMVDLQEQVSTAKPPTNDKSGEDCNHESEEQVPEEMIDFSSQVDNLYEREAVAEIMADKDIFELMCKKHPLVMHKYLMQGKR